jgi:hypothetical protein
MRRSRSQGNEIWTLNFTIKQLYDLNLTFLSSIYLLIIIIIIDITGVWTQGFSLASQPQFSTENYGNYIYDSCHLKACVPHWASRSAH